MGTPVQASADHPSSSGDLLSAAWFPVHVVRSLHHPHSNFLGGEEINREF